MRKMRDFQKAVGLRKEGKSYSEIASAVAVSQSTLSLWLRNVSLSQRHRELLASKKRDGQLKGASSRRRLRLEQEKIIFEKSSHEVGKITKRELWLLGAVAYWCEGAKQKKENISQGIIFANSDVFLLRLFLRWLKDVCLITESNIKCSLYIHESTDKEDAINYWSKVLNIAKDGFGKTILKKHKIRTNRKNINNQYHGLIRIEVKKSTILNRKIRGWISGIDSNLS